MACSYTLYGILAGTIKNEHKIGDVLNQETLSKDFGALRKVF
jgi:hypothetical protein